MVQFQEAGKDHPGAAKAAPARLLHHDRRADDHLRSVSLTRDMVRIDRRLEGIAMRLAVPVRAYRGVALSLRPDRDGELRYRLHLLHPDRDLSVDLDAAADDHDILADWRLWSRFFRLPALVERQAGEIVEADPLLGDVQPGGRGAARRASGVARQRRPRFLRRRKIGVWPETVVVHESASEIIART